MLLKVETPRAGLANMLFPWARAHVYSVLHGIPMVRPRWSRLKAGPLIRRERDPRHYLGQFQSDGQLGPWRLTASRLRGGCLRPEPSDLRRPPTPEWAGEEDVIVFSGVNGLFVPLLPYGEIVKDGLHSIAHRAIVTRCSSIEEADIVLHVRHGDFTEAKAASDFVERGAVRTPLRWFVQLLREIRKAAARELSVAVVTDSSEEEIREVLSEPRTRLVRSGTALGDLLYLVRARLILGSGGSSFTAWGSFLSGAPTVVVEGQSLAWFGLGPQSGFPAYVSGLHSPDPAVVRACVDRLGREGLATHALPE